jgi:HPt (histidine-containing phosphotransfer) domain-containing protein
VSKPLVEGDLAAEIRRVTGRSSKTSEPAGPVSSQETVDENREPIDRAFLYRNLGTNSAVLKRICSLFLQMCPHQMRDIREAVQSQDWLTVQRATHKVRGSVGTFAANAAVQAAHRLEAAARVPDAAGVQTCLVDLDREVERLVPAVTQLLAEVSASL